MTPTKDVSIPRFGSFSFIWSVLLGKCTAKSDAAYAPKCHLFVAYFELGKKVKWNPEKSWWDKWKRAPQADRRRKRRRRRRRRERYLGKGTKTTSIDWEFGNSASHPCSSFSINIGSSFFTKKHAYVLKHSSICFHFSLSDIDMGEKCPGLENGPYSYCFRILAISTLVHWKSPVEVPFH